MTSLESPIIHICVLFLYDFSIYTVRSLMNFLHETGGKVPVRQSNFYCCIHIVDGQALATEFFYFIIDINYCYCQSC